MGERERHTVYALYNRNAARSWIECWCHWATERGELKDIIDQFAQHVADRRVKGLVAEQSP